MEQQDIKALAKQVGLELARQSGLSAPNCNHCNRILVDPVAMTCCGATFCLWCLDPGLARGMPETVKACLFCGGSIAKFKVCSLLLELVERLVGQAELAKERQQRKNLLNGKQAADQYLKSERLQKLKNWACRILHDPENGLAFLHVNDYVKKLTEKAKFPLEPGEAELMLGYPEVFQTAYSWRRGDFIALIPKTYRHNMIAQKNWDDLEDSMVIHELENSAQRDLAFKDYAAWTGLPIELIGELSKPRFVPPTPQFWLEQVQRFAYRIKDLHDASSESEEVSSEYDEETSSSSAE